MIFEDTFSMSSRYEIPKLALGTWLIPDDQAANAVLHALEIGYRHIDTAQAYGNERGVGEGLSRFLSENPSVKRSDVFITSKVLAETKNYEEAASSIDESLAKLGLDYIDLMLIHCPTPWDDFGSDKHYFEENKQVWKALEEAVAAGKVRSIGVSNFSEVDIENILSSCTIRPAINQISCSILRTPLDLITYCKEQGILVESYCPNAHGDAINNEQIAVFADKYGVSNAQLCIKYTLQLGTVSLPKTTNPDHMRENASMDFEIDQDDMEALMALGTK